MCVRFFGMVFSLALAGALGAGDVAAKTYTCSFVDPGRNRSIPKTVVVETNAQGTATVVDPLLETYQQSPKTARFLEDTDDILRVHYRIDDVDFADGGKSDLDFSLVYNKSKMRAWISVTIPNYDNTDSGTGSCEEMK